MVKKIEMLEQCSNSDSSLASKRCFKILKQLLLTNSEHEFQTPQSISMSTNEFFNQFRITDRLLVELMINTLS